MEALKPCPWCARTETLSVDTEANTCTGNPPQQWYASVCCLCFDGDFCYPVTATGQTEEEAKEKAIRSWNHRPIEDALRARIAAKDEEIAKLSASLHHARQLAQSTHEVAKLAWGGEIPSPLPGHRRQTEEEFAAEMERLNCPLCGGSGHVDDADTAIVSRIAQLEAVAEAAAVISDIIAQDDLIPSSVSYLKTFNDALDAAGYKGE